MSGGSEKKVKLVERKQKRRRRRRRRGRRRGMETSGTRQSHPPHLRLDMKHELGLREKKGNRETAEERKKKSRAEGRKSG